MRVHLPRRADNTRGGLGQSAVLGLPVGQVEVHPDFGRRIKAPNRHGVVELDPSRFASSTGTVDTTGQAK